ncbi:MAG: magnesium/cobalt transporter CorA [Planctomycetota bacterium]|nr:magnesium/cobalt transporter CorA [Planctomycetota bacterium]
MDRRARPRRRGLPAPAGRTLSHPPAGPGRRRPRAAAPEGRRLRPSPLPHRAHGRHPFGLRDGDQISFFLGRNYVLTFNEGWHALHAPEGHAPAHAPTASSLECFDPVRARIRRSGSPIRRHGADYLFYALLDAIVDNYFPCLEAFGEFLETLEEETVTRPSPNTLIAIHAAKRELLDLRRILWPQRETISQIIRDESPLLGKEVRVYLRDCHDHAVQVMDMVETYREIASGLHDVYLSALGHRTNEIMKVLTIITTIFIPLSFIAGVYGMNFNTEKSPWNMPELNAYYGYPATLGLMALITAGMLYFFVRKGWIAFGRQDDLARSRGEPASPPPRPAATPAPEAKPDALQAALAKPE